MSDLAANAPHPNVRSESVGDLVGLRAAEAPPHNLPAQLTSFVGRERELRELAQALSDTNILTLTGAGGCGKSRLALQAASEVLERYPDGAWWVELAPISDPALVGPALAQALAVRPLPGQSDLDAAITYLAANRALVLLDNCEHLLDEAAQVAEALARGCPEVTVVATSREPLRAAGETDWRVPSLSLPGEPEPDNGQAGLADRSDAARLFVARAAKVRPGFQLSDENASAIVRICRELDGIPLAIELAAARLRLLSPEQIAAGLADRFRLLTDGTRTALPRHRTLRGSVDWSHELLTEAERRLFRRLGVFTGGFTLEAAERICAGDGIEPGELFDLLASLVEKSLVLAEEGGSEVRYRLLETVRHYALERLADAGEMGTVRGRQRDFYLELAERIEPELLAPEPSELLDPEAANLTQAIGWAAETDPEKALRLCVALIFWWMPRRLVQGAASSRRALEASGAGKPSALRARALWGRAWLEFLDSDFETAFQLGKQALAEAERVGDQVAMGRALHLIAMGPMLFDPAASRPALERTRELAIASGDEFCLMAATQGLAYSYTHQNAHREARPLFEEAIPLGERLGRWETVSWAWSGIAWAEWAAGEHGAGREACDRALAAAWRGGEVVSEGSATTMLALLDIDAGAPERALSRLAPIRERALAFGDFNLPWIVAANGRANAAAGRLEDACSELEALIEEGAGGIVSALTPAYVSYAEALRLLGRNDEAGAVGRRGLELAKQHGDRWIGAQAQLVLGCLAAGRGGWAEAERLRHEALAAIVECDYRSELPRALEALAEVAAGLESYEEAGRILGAARRIRRELGLVAWKHQRDEVEGLQARLRETLDADGLEQAVGEGEALTTEEAIGYIRRARGSRKRPPGGWESLTPTELEVARHAAEGLTNPEIGARMFISRGTVRTHLSHIYAKLGIKNRSELAAEVTRRNPSPAEPKSVI